MRDFGQELAHSLTESKIWLRGIEDVRARNDNEVLASQGIEGGEEVGKRKAEEETLTDEERERETKKRNAIRRRDINLVRMSWKDIGDVNSHINGNDLDDLIARENKILHQPKTTRFLF